MATERAGGTRRERAVERDGDDAIYVDRGGSGVGGVILGIVVLALAAIIAFFLLNESRNDSLRADAVTRAAVADSAAMNVGDAAPSVADSATK